MELNINTRPLHSLLKTDDSIALYTDSENNTRISQVLGEVPVESLRRASEFRL